MVRWKLILGVILIFMLGALAGTFGTGMYIHHRFPGPPPGPKDPKTRFMEEVTTRLQLTGDQLLKFREMVDQMAEEFHQCHESHHQQMEEIRAKWLEAIKKVLTPGQIEELEKLNREFEERAARFRPPPPPNGGMRGDDRGPGGGAERFRRPPPPQQGGGIKELFMPPPPVRGKGPRGFPGPPPGEGRPGDCPPCPQGRDDPASPPPVPMEPKGAGAN